MERVGPAQRLLPGQGPRPPPWLTCLWRLPGTAFRRAEQRIDDAHVQDRVLERKFEWRLPHDGARECVPLQSVLIADREFLDPRPAAEQVRAGVDQDSRRPVGRRVERDLDLDPTLVSDDRDPLMRRQLRPDSEGQMPAAGKFENGADETVG